VNPHQQTSAPPTAPQGVRSTLRTRPALHAMRGLIVRAVEEKDQLRAAIAYCTAYETVAVGRKKDQSQDEKDKLLRIRWFRLVVTQLYTADFADAGTMATTARATFDVIMSQPLATLQLSTHVIGSKSAETISLSSAYTPAVPNVLAFASVPNDNAPNAVKVGDTQPKGRRGGGDTTEAQRLLFNRTVEAVDHAGRVALLRVTGEWVRTEVLNTDPKNRRLRIRHIITDDDGDDAREPAQWMSETELNADYTAAKAWSWGEKLEGTQGESIVPTSALEPHDDRRARLLDEAQENKVISTSTIHEFLTALNEAHPTSRCIEPQAFYSQITRPHAAGAEGKRQFERAASKAGKDIAGRPVAIVALHNAHFVALTVRPDKREITVWTRCRTYALPIDNGWPKPHARRRRLGTRRQNTRSPSTPRTGMCSEPRRTTADSSHYQQRHSYAPARVRGSHETRSPK
jgi:hypothetical protein